MLLAAQQLNLHRLAIFLTVVDSGGFSAAAKKLYMSQPSVSNHVRQLEAALDAVLIDRSGARVRPTPQGKVLVEHARRLFAVADETVAAIRQVSGLETGRLVVGGTTTVGTYLLPQLVANFRRFYQGIDCDIFVGNGAQVVHRLLEGSVGLAVLAGPPTAPQLVSERILSERLLLITPPNHPLAGKSVAADALAGERFLLREPGSLMRQQQEDALDLWEITAVVRSEMWGPETVKQAVANGLGVALVSEHAVAYEVEGGRLAVVEVEPTLPARPIVVAHRRDRLLTPAEQAFIDLLRDIEAWPAPLTPD